MRSLSLLALLLAPVGAFAQANATIPDPDPEVERKSFQVAEGFEVNLFAADPLLAKPIQMNFDPQGRLWVACSEVYPQIKPGQTANDKVLILEDTNGDGKADKTTIFADGLLIPTGVAPGDGGAYVADSTDIVHFANPDPKTGKARSKRIVLSGFGTEDTHHIIHTFRWGPDTLLYFNQSIYIHSHIETPHGVRRLNAGGIWQFRPETTKLEVFARGFVNTWGTSWDRWGATFATDGAYGEGINYLVPGAYYVTAQRSPRMLTGLNPGSPKHCGLEIVGGRHLPDDWQGNCITNDFRGHRVCRFALKPDGSGYASQEKPEVIKTSHPAFRPIDVKMGPDGAIYIADWYNPIIQHGEVDFRDPRRDKTHGRIWRVTAKGRKLVERPKLVDATVPELLEQLKAPEDWTRTQAKRVLKERGAKAVLPELEKWTAKLDPADPNVEHHRLESLWMMQAFETLKLGPILQVLKSPDPRSRAAGYRVAGAMFKMSPREVVSLRFDADKMFAAKVNPERITDVMSQFGATLNMRDVADKSDPVEFVIHPGKRAADFLDAVVKDGPQPVRFSSIVKAEVTVKTVSPIHVGPAALFGSGVVDDHPQVRLEAVRALAEIPTAESAVVAAKALDKPVDKWLDYAIWLTLRDLAPVWLPELQAGKLDFGGDPKKIVFALRAAGSGDVAQPLVQLLKSGKVAKDREADVWLVLARVGGPAELGGAIAFANDHPDAIKQEVLTTVEESVRIRKVGPPVRERISDLVVILAESTGTTRQTACRLIGLWKQEWLRPTLEELAHGEGVVVPASVDDRRAAFEGLALLGGDKARTFFVAQTAQQRKPVTRRLAAIALAGIDIKTAAEKAADLLATTDDPADLFAAFTQRKSGATDLALALKGKTLPADVAKVGLRVAKASGQPDQALVDALTKAGGLTAPKRDWSKAEIDALAADAAKLGDPARGEQVFRRNELTCLKCHGIAGAGGQVGPDMTSIGASAPIDYLVESLLLTNAKIKEGFHSAIVNTVDGKVVTGIKVRETPTELVLRDAEDKEIVIPKADIESNKPGKSLMPDGLTDPLTRQEFLDLTRFLSALGKVGGGYTASPGRVVRRWQTVQPTKELYTLTNRDRIAAVAKPGANVSWLPAYSLVSGDLPLDVMAKFQPHKGGPVYGVARFQLEATTAGPVKLLLNSTAGTSVWADGNPLDAAKEMTLTLAAGMHTITVAVDTEVRKEALRVEMDEIAGSAARVRIIGGK